MIMIFDVYCFIILNELNPNAFHLNTGPEKGLTATNVVDQPGIVLARRVGQALRPISDTDKIGDVHLSIPSRSSTGDFRNPTCSKQENAGSDRIIDSVSMSV